MDLSEYLQGNDAQSDIKEATKEDLQSVECKGLPGIFMHRLPGSPPWAVINVKDHSGMVLAVCSYRRVDEVRTTWPKDAKNIPIYTADDLGQSVRSLGLACGVTKWSQDQISAMAKAIGRAEFNGGNLCSTSAGLYDDIRKVLQDSSKILALSADPAFHP